MKRLVVCLAIIAAIIAAGIFSISAVSSKNDRLYGHIQSVLDAYGSGEDAREEISALENYFQKDYAPCLGCFVNDNMISELSVSVFKLRPMLESECDEFTAECEAIRTGAERIYRSELPVAYRIM